MKNVMHNDIRRALDRILELEVELKKQKEEDEKYRVYHREYYKGLAEIAQVGCRHCGEMACRALRRARGVE